MTAGIDWSTLGFDIIKTKSFLKYTWKDGKWDDGVFVSTQNIEMNAFATGLKAFKDKQGKIRIFRPELNAKRLQLSCAAVSMPSPPVEMFIDGVVRAVKDNADYVPPLESKGSMYIRPFVFGSGGCLGLSPSSEFQFIILVNPVGDYYKGGMGSPCKALIQYGFDRASPFGVGHVKLGGNYGPVFGPTARAKKDGYLVNLFLDPKTQTYIEEFGTSNFVALKKSNGKTVYVTPKSNSILPSITNRSLAELASSFGWEIEMRKIPWNTLQEYDEIAAVGTAVVITPVAQIDRQIPSKEIKETQVITDLSEMWERKDEPVELKIESVKVNGDYSGFKELYKAYREIQNGERPDTFGWMYPADGI
ncbi:hypothetical protein HK103_006295 [Boothiomyces macroporosus]|uniref:Branched-chain amino acid aminotransferase n=1 Tax=Boothiomyces macroporosus TaxID=261099 RepID=A0AAD5Y6R3_9FUNG|nr:hypothetical protein HK103_006295 [Boothiomyces macroporosus]